MEANNIAEGEAEPYAAPLVSEGVLRLFWWFSLAIALVIGPALGSERLASRGSGCGEARGADRLRGVTGLGEPVLESGETARLSGIRIPEEPAWREAASTWLKQRAGRSLLVRDALPLDRWARRPARLVLADSPSRLDLAQGLVEAGLALVDPGADTFCRPELLALEETARERGLGLWGEDRYKAVSVRQADALRERIGRFVLVEGPVRSVGEREHRTYLNFGSDWTSDFTITIPKRTWSLMLERGLTAKALTGRTIRARGILEDRQGPALTVTVPEMIETIQHGHKQR